MLTDLQIFKNAPQHLFGKELESYLDGACGGDAALRAKVAALFQAGANAGDFMNRPAAEALSTEVMEPPAIRLGPGATIGRCKLLQRLGEGGMGEVYMAQQEKPVRRRVALKLIKMGMDTQQVLARFEAEGQALALMDHSNIAKVFDVGATETGRPYMVMELVRGRMITEYCDQHRLPLRDRLALFVQVCSAIQHAHQKGIIHRDLKPSNILVTHNDGVAVPKVIDFGIAKAIEQKLTDKTLFTQFQSLVGTPAYMSPEQADLSSVDIDTRSDIYALGVLLYQLLTGRTPFDGQELLNSGVDEMRRMIREKEPVRPSTRLRTLLAAELATLARHHRADAPHQLAQSIRGDLDWIVMKCLEKDRTRRYETANGLALDIKRYLGNEPVLARPPSVWYRTQKLVKRNKLAVMTTTVVFAALAIGLVAAMWGLNEAQEQRQEAASRATALARRVYLMQLAKADQALQGNNLVRARNELENCAETQRGWEWRFLRDRIAGALSEELPSSEQPCFSSDGTHIVGIARNRTPYRGTAIVQEVSSLRRVAEFDHDKELMSLALSPRDQWLAAGDVDGALVLWNFKTQEKVWERPEAPRKGYAGIAQSDDGSRIGLAFSPDGQRIATANFTTTLKVLNVVDGAETFSVDLGSLIRKVMFSPDGRWIAAGSGGRPDDPGGIGHSVLVDTHSGKIIEFPLGAKVPTFSPDGRQIATGNPSSRTLTLWDWNGEELTLQKSWKGGSSSRFFDLCYLPDGVHLASAQGWHVMVWNLQTHKLAAYVMPNFADWLAASPQGDIIAICGATTRGSGGPGLYLWHYRGSNKRLTIGPLEHPCWLLDFSPDGKKLALGSHRGQPGMSVLERAGPVRIADCESGEIIATIAPACRGFSWMPDSRYAIVTSDPDQRHEMYDTTTGTLVRQFEGDSALSRPFVDQTGRRLMSFARDTTDTTAVRTWDMVSGQLNDTFVMEAIKDPGAVRQRSEGFWNAAIGPDGYQVAASGGLSNVRRWDTRSQEELPKLPNGGSSEDALAFTDDGRAVYLCGRDTFGIYDAESGQRISEFAGPSGAVALSPDQTQMVSCGDGIVVWDVASGLPLISLSSADDGEFAAVDWSPDNTRIAAAREDGTVHLWSLPIAR